MRLLVPILAVLVVVLGAAPAFAASTLPVQQFVKPHRSTAAGDLLRVGSLQRVQSVRLVGYVHRSATLRLLRRHVRRGVVGISRSGRPVPVARVLAGGRRSRFQVRKDRARHGRGMILRLASATPRLRSEATVPRDPPTASGVAGGASSGSGVPPQPGFFEGCWRPYAATSAFNTPIRSDARVHSRSASYVASMEPATARLSSDPAQYTWPVYYVDATTPTVRVTYRSWFSEVSSGGAVLTNHRFGGDPLRQIVDVPIPPEAIPSAGSDGNLVMVNRSNGDEWNMSEFRRDAGGVSVNNVSRYNVHWSGVPPLDRSGDPYWNNGAGVPLLGGLVRPCEIARGVVEHALSFAYPATTPEFVWPATKSDGRDPTSSGMPEGTLLQLDPSIDDAEIHGWGCEGACLVIARALQRYGMYLLNGSGRPKLMVEDEHTADWRGVLEDDTVAPIPLERFRALEPAAP